MMESENYNSLIEEDVKDAVDFVFKDYKKPTESYRYFIYDFDEKKYPRRKLKFMKNGK